MSLPIELRVSLFVPATNPATQLLESLARELRERTHGALSLVLFPNETLGSTAEQYDLARTGKADLAYFMHGATPGRFPLTELAALPFVTRDPLSGTAALMHALPGFLAAEHPGTHVLFLVANAPMAIHATRPIAAVADLAGLRVRSAGAVVASTLLAVGAQPANVMPLEVPAAMSDGRIDAAAMTFEGAMINRLAQVASHSLELNANTVTFGLAMNGRRYAALSPDLRAALDDVLGSKAGQRLATKLAEAVDDGRRYMRDGGVAIAELSVDDRSRIRSDLEAVSRATIDALQCQGLPAKDVYAILMGDR
jgi:TRAP-type C4-dicarboxylate transport system substrate-binding protein